MNHIYIIHTAVDGHPGCLHFGNEAASDMDEQVSVVRCIYLNLHRTHSLKVVHDKYWLAYLHMQTTKGLTAEVIMGFIF